VYPYPTADGKSADPIECTTDAAGEVTVKGLGDARKLDRVLAADAAGRIGTGRLPADGAGFESEQEVAVALINTASRAGRVTTADGKPVAGATIAPLEFSARERRGPWFNSLPTDQQA